MNSILQNAVKITEDGKVTYLVSSHRNHYNSYTFADGEFFAVDGGNDYIRRGFSQNLEGKSIENYNLGTDSPENELVEKLLWGTRGRSGKDKLTYLPLISLSQEHLQNILKDNDEEKFVTPLSEHYLFVIKKLLGIV
jgi:hypothetical protein